MDCTICPTGTLKTYKYVVIISFYEGKLLLSRHRARATWETQGGHIERGETPLDAARRELYEESGAEAFAIAPLCDYRAGEAGTDDWANGRAYAARIARLGALPQSEMAETRAFDALPAALTYPDITPVLFAELQKRGGISAAV